ncbi:hypothetical protein BASA81_003696 [Batrachochytrium salamandrivorans]|nr:hypothetical protein BASA81_003696 [Batrachochytrium salamandrivorans]
MELASRVLVNRRRVDFGQCFRCLLGGVEGETGEVYVQWELDSNTLELNLMPHSQGGKGNGVPFEHSPTCPAQIQNLPNPLKSVKIGVATLLEDAQGRVLITQRHSQLRSFPNVWVLPGGHLEVGETMFQAAEREVNEETGLTGLIPYPQLLGIWESTFPHLSSLGKITHHHAVCYVHSKLVSSEQVINVQTAEVQAVCWLTREQCKAILQSDSQTNVHVHRVHKDDEHQPGSSWHENRALVQSQFESLPCSDMYSNMSAGTHFALRQWLLKQLNSLL